MPFYGKVNGEWEQFSTLETFKTFLLVYSDSGGEVRNVLEDGSASDWTFGGHSGTVNDVAIDEDGFVYSCSTDGTVRKNDSGTELWSYSDTGVSFNAISVQNGFVYVGNDAGEVIKINADSGSLSADGYAFTAHTGTLNGLMVDYAGYAHTVSADQTLRRVDPQGNQLWRFDGHGRTINGVDLGADGSVYTAAFGQVVKKVYSNGNEAWSFSGFNSTVNDVAINQDTGAVYGVDNGGVIRKIDNMTGTQQAEANVSASSLNTVSVSQKGDIYVGDSEQNVKEIIDTGAGLSTGWEFNAPTNAVQGTAVLVTT